MSSLATQLARAIDTALAHLERNRISDAQVVLHGAQELAEAHGAADREVERLFATMPMLAPPVTPAWPVSQDEE